MKKEALKRAALGFPIGIAMSAVIALIVSFASGEGEFIAFVPELAENVGGELNAAAIQTLLSGLLGAGCGAVSVIWDIGIWSIIKQTGVFFLSLFSMLMPVSYLLYWMEHSVSGFISYFVVFFGIFILTWISQYFMWKQKIKQLNEQINK